VTDFVKTCRTCRYSQDWDRNQHTGTWSCHCVLKEGERIAKIRLDENFGCDDWAEP
jgi:hypothetical protein